MKFKILFLLVVVFQSVYSQIDKKFWFAAPDISAQHGDSPVFIRFSAVDKDATVKLSIPAKNILIGTYSVKANILKTVELTSYLVDIECGNYGSVMKNGLFLESDQEITAYYEVAGMGTTGPSNSDIFSLKGSNALGQYFMLPMQNFWTQEKRLTDAWATFQIVAAENNTQVQIIPTQNLSKTKKGDTLTITLNKGEVYTERAASNAPNLKPTGTVIKSNKNVAVTITDDSMYDDQTTAWGAWDTAGDQIVPVQKVGTKYIVNRASNQNLGIDRVFITATEDSTSIIINSNVTVSINKGVTYAYLLNQNYSLINSNKPVYVFHIGGFNSELGGALLPPINCTGSKKVALGLENLDGTVELSVVVAKGGESSFLFDGKSGKITANDFSILPYDTNYLCAKISVNDLTNIPYNILVENSKVTFQLGMFNQISGTFAYGYFSDFGTINLPDSITVCPNAKIELNAGFGKDSYTWFKDGVKLDSTKSILKINQRGLYKTIALKDNCQFIDSTFFNYHKLDTVLFAKHTINVCPNNSDTLKLLKEYISYKWFDNTTLKQKINLIDTLYKVTVTDSNECVKSDSVNVKWHNVTKLQSTFLSELEFCNTNTCIPFVFNTGFRQYIYNDSAYTTNQLCLNKKQNSNYKFTVVDTNGCVQKDSIFYECSLYIGQIPNIITPKTLDNLNDSFEINKLMTGYWTLNVYNRYGVLVYKNENYDNSWKGEGVEGGIYYYQLSHKNKDIQHKGWLEIR